MRMQISHNESRAYICYLFNMIIYPIENLQAMKPAKGTQPKFWNFSVCFSYYLWLADDPWSNFLFPAKVAIKKHHFRLITTIRHLKLDSN